jgi:hypothetical protein
MATTENTIFSKKVIRRMLGLSLHAWEDIMALSLAVAAIAATIVGVSTYAVVQLQRHEARESAEKNAFLNNETAKLHAQNALTSDALLTNAHAGKSNAITGLATQTIAERIALAQGLVDPKSISEAGRSLSIIPKVTSFAGKKFDAVVTSIDIELGTLLIALKNALTIAGWIEIARSDPTAGVGILSMDRASGPALVRIEVGASEDPALLDAAKSLASALNEEGIAATVSPKAESDPANASVIHILVGAKP